MWYVKLVLGVKVVFRVALVLLKYSLGRQGVLKKCPTMCETLEALRNPPLAIMDEEFMVQKVNCFIFNYVGKINF